MKRHLPLWAKQSEALERAWKFLEKQNGCPLFLEMGTGKSRITVHIIERLVNQGEKLFLVAAPLSVMRVWVEAWHEWGEFPILFIDLNKSGSAGLRQAQELSKTMPVICLINYDLVWRLGFKTEKKFNEIKKKWVSNTKKVDTTVVDLSWSLTVLDESTAIKTPGSKVSRFIRRYLSKVSKKRLVLTGSGYIKRPLDVWAQVDFVLAPDKNTTTPIFPLTMEAFKARYTIPHPYIRGAIKGYQNMDDMVKRLNSVAILLKKSDVLDLKEPTHTTSWVELSAKTRKLYKTLTDEQFLELEELERQGQTVTAAHIFSMMIKQRQLASGFLITDPEEDPETGLITKRDLVVVSDEKVQEVIRILEDRDDPTLIVTQFDQEELMLEQAIKKKFGFTPKILNGSVKGSEARHELIKSASTDLCFIVKESVGCKGNDMRWADLTIWLSHRDHTEDYDQMMSRNHRGGQTKHITYRHIIASDTIDEKIMRSLNNDLSLAAELERNWRALFQ